jgi:hypothetical protein
MVDISILCGRFNAPDRRLFLEELYIRAQVCASDGRLRRWR